jgi:hypothetical protein
VGADVAELVAKYTDGIITGLKGSDGRAFGMAMQLIGEVDKGAFKKWVKQITTIAVCVLAIVGIVISLFFTGPAAAVLVPAVLFILNSLGWLLVDSTQVNDKFGDYFWKVSSNWGWGGSTIVDDAKIAAMFTPYQNGNKWNLQQLQNEFRNKSASNMLRVNGRSGQSFDQWLEILGLRGKLDFTKDGVTVNDAEQLKALKWLVATVEHEKILTESAAKARQRGDGVREQQNRPQLPTYVDLYYNPQTDIYAMKTRKRVALVSPSSVSHAADLCGEITFGGVRVWVQDVL